MIVSRVSLIFFAYCSLISHHYDAFINVLMLSHPPVIKDASVSLVHFTLMKSAGIVKNYVIVICVN